MMAGNLVGAGRVGGIGPGRIDRVLSIGAMILFTAAVAAIARGHDQWRLVHNPAGAAEGFRKTDLASGIIAFWPGLPLFPALGNHEGEWGNNLTGTPNNVAIWDAQQRTAYLPGPTPDGFFTGDTQSYDLSGNPCVATTSAPISRSVSNIFSGRPMPAKARTLRPRKRSEDSVGTRRARSSAHSGQSSIVGARKYTRRPEIRVMPDNDKGTSAKRNMCRVY